MKRKCNTAPSFRDLDLRKNERLGSPRIRFFHRLLWHRPPWAPDRIRAFFHSVMKKILLATVPCIIVGCAATGPMFSPAPPAEPDKALVYIYRTNDGAASLRNAYFSIDGVDIATLGVGGYTWAHVPSGRHVLAQRWAMLDVPLLTRKLEFPGDWTAGETYYYRFGVSVKGFSPMVFTYTLTEVPATQAKAEILNTRLEQPKNADQLKITHD